MPTAALCYRTVNKCCKRICFELGAVFRSDTIWCVIVRISHSAAAWVAAEAITCIQSGPESSPYSAVDRDHPTSCCECGPATRFMCAAGCGCGSGACGGAAPPSAPPAGAAQRALGGHAAAAGLVWRQRPPARPDLLHLTVGPSPEFRCGGLEGTDAALHHRPLRQGNILDSMQRWHHHEAMIRRAGHGPSWMVGCQDRRRCFRLLPGNCSRLGRRQTIRHGWRHPGNCSACVAAILPASLRV